MSKIVAIIQARIGSARLPYKMMLSLHGSPIIEWVISRVKKSIELDDIVVAIPQSKDNDILEKYIQKMSIKVFRGSESNVLSRFFEAAKYENATHIVRVCADNPLVDGNEIDNLIEFYKNNPCDYAYNHIPKENLYPDGLGAEIISFNVLNDLYQEVTLQHHKEHCFSYIWDNKENFTIKTFDPKEKYLHHPELKFDIDTFDDYFKLAMKEININMTSKELVTICRRKNENT